MVRNMFLTGALLLFICGCAEQPKETSQKITMEAFQAGPQLVKIPITGKEEAEKILATGVDVVVIEDSYLIVRISGEEAKAMDAMQTTMQPVQEKDLVQRLIRVYMNDPSDLQQIGDTGIDVWEVKGDTVVAQAYDKYIR